MVSLTANYLSSTGKVQCTFGILRPTTNYPTPKFGSKAVVKRLQKLTLAVFIKLPDDLGRIFWITQSHFHSHGNQN